MIWTENVEATIEFYKENFDFVCGDKNDEWGWAGLYHGNVDLMIAKPNEHIPFDKPGFTGTFYFYIDNVEELWNKLKDKLRVAYPIDTFDWGMREFAVYDNNGYMLQFGQDLRK
jgi:uncharacterized glyoxalase superfamily protein PhnB